MNLDSDCQAWAEVIKKTQSGDPSVIEGLAWILIIQTKDVEIEGSRLPDLSLKEAYLVMSVVLNIGDPDWWEVRYLAPSDEVEQVVEERIRHLVSLLRALGAFVR